MDEKTLLADLERRMDGALEALGKEFSGLRTGRASTSLLETVVVESYGAKMPINQVATVTAPEPRLLVVQVWDKGQVTAVSKGIRDANLGLNPMEDGAMIRVPIPELNEERRLELAKVAGKYAEQARVSIRNVRRDGMDSVKKMDDASEDQQRAMNDNIQQLTDKMVKQVDTVLEKKEQEIKQV